MIKKYNIFINKYEKKNIVINSNLWNVIFLKEIKTIKISNRIRYIGRFSYNLQKFYLSNKNVWYNQKKKIINNKIYKKNYIYSINYNKSILIKSKLN